MLSYQLSLKRVAPLNITRHASKAVATPRARGRPRTKPALDEAPQLATFGAARRARGRPRKTTGRDEALSVHARASAEDEGHQAAAAAEGAVGREREKVQTQTLVTSLRTAQQTKKRTKGPLPVRLDTSPHHKDLPSFLSYAVRTKLSAASSVYRGTHYEYTVAQTLSSYAFNLTRTGRSNDLGIDLTGTWSLPSEPHHMRVIAQCKASKPMPSMVRELEGAYIGAPAGWQGDGVLALLVCSRPATKGVREAVQRSRWLMGVLQVDKAGEVKQFIWNARAADAGLEGLSVTVRYESDSTGDMKVRGRADSELPKAKDGETTTGSIALTWLGRPWRPKIVDSTKVSPL